VGVRVIVAKGEIIVIAKGKTMSSKLNKMVKVSESFTVNRYDNGWMVEISGRDKKEDWKTSKTLCNTEEELLALIREYNTMDLDS
jgi:hypothetical protein